MLEIKLFDHLCKQVIDIELFVIHSNIRNHLTVCKRMSLGPFKNVIDKMYLQIIYLVHMYKED